MEYKSVDAEGLAGGLLCIWKSGVFSLLQCFSTRNFVLLSGTIHPDFQCVLINIYAPNDVVRRSYLWNVLVNLKSQFKEPWCIGGISMRLESWVKERGVQGRIEE